MCETETRRRYLSLYMHSTSSIHLMYSTRLCRDFYQPVHPDWTNVMNVLDIQCGKWIDAKMPRPANVQGNVSPGIHLPLFPLVARVSCLWSHDGSRFPPLVVNRLPLCPSLRPNREARKALAGHAQVATRTFAIHALERAVVIGGCQEVLFLPHAHSLGHVEHGSVQVQEPRSAGTSMPKDRRENSFRGR